MDKETLGLNVCLLTMARSRSSMTAEIFRQHGFWFGRTFMLYDAAMGYNENRRLKLWARKHRNNPYDSILDGSDPQMPRGLRSEWEAIRKDEGWKEGNPWAVKVDAFCDECFATEAHLVGIYRNKADILASCQECMGERYAADAWEKIIDAHHDHMEALDIPMINTDDLIQGEYRALGDLFENLGLVLDFDVLERVIGAKRSRLSAGASR